MIYAGLKVMDKPNGDTHREVICISSRTEKIWDYIAEDGNFKFPSMYGHPEKEYVYADECWTDGARIVFAKNEDDPCDSITITWTVEETKVL